MKPFSFFALLLLCTLVIPVSHYFLTKSDLFNFENIVLVNSKNLEIKPDLDLLLTKFKNKPLFGLDLDKISQIINTHPKIQNSKISRRPPNILRIKTLKHKPAARLAGSFKSKNILVSQTGQIYLEENGQNNQDKDRALPELKLRKSQNNNNLGKLAELIKPSLTALKSYQDQKNLLGKINSISSDLAQNIIFQTNNGLKIYLPKENYDIEWNQLFDLVQYMRGTSRTKHQTREIEAIRLGKQNSNRIVLKYKP